MCFTPLFLFFLLQESRSKNSLVCLSSFFLYTPSVFFFILILCLVLFIFFSNKCHSSCCPDVVGQPSILSSSSFLKVIVNKDFWDLLSYFDKLFVVLNATVSSGLLWIYQEDLKGILGQFVHTSKRCFGSLEHGLVWAIQSINLYLEQLLCLFMLELRVMSPVRSDSRGLGHLERSPMNFYSPLVLTSGYVSLLGGFIF